MHYFKMAAELLVLSLLGLCAMAGFVACQTCHEDWHYFQDSCYGFGEDSTTWGDAQAICKASNGKLAEIESAEENTFLKSIVKNKRAQFTWIGGTDMFHEGNWVWTSTNKQLQPFVDWAPGEPNDADREDCLTYNSAQNYQWNDRGCGVTLSFLCESRPVDAVVG